MTPLDHTQEVTSAKRRAVDDILIDLVRVLARQAAAEEDAREQTAREQRCSSGRKGHPETKK